MTRRTLRAAACAAAATLALSATGARADEVVAYEGFNYAAGSLLAGQNGGFGWAGAWTYTVGGSASGSIAQGLSYTDASGRALSTSGGAWNTSAGVFFGQALRATTTDFGAADSSVWLSFLVQQSGTPTSGINYAMATPGTGYTFGSNAMLGGVSGNGATVGPFYSGTGSVSLANTVPAQSTSFIVLRVDFAATGNDTMSLWLNPLLGGTAGAADLVLSAQNYSSLINGLTLAHGDGRAFAFDELRIGTSFAAVTPVPEPAEWLLMASGLAVLALCRKRQALRADQAPS